MGTVVLTGANGSMGIHATERLLNVHPDLTLVLTVRDSSSTDPNTAHLRSVISKYPKSKAHIYQLDLSSLAEVRDFTNNITSNIDRGELPRLKAVVCTAMFWNLVNPAQLTIDGYDQTIQIDHIANVALVLRLLGHFAPQGGRIVLLSSINHIPGKSPTEKIPPMIPPDLDQMVHPKPDADHKGQGVELYSNAKLLLTTWGYALNDYLAGKPDLSSITAVTIDPGTLCDSRAFVTNTPSSIINMQRFILRPLRPVFRFFNQPFRRAADGAADVVDLATNVAHAGEQGYFTLLEKGESAPQSMDKEIQQRVWLQSATWAKVTIV